MTGYVFPFSGIKGPDAFSVTNSAWTRGAAANDNGDVISHTVQRSAGLANASTVLMQRFCCQDPAKLSSASEASGLDTVTKPRSYPASRLICRSSALPWPSVRASVVVDGAFAQRPTA